MIETPHITRVSVQLTAIIHLTIPRAEIQQVMGPGIRELKEAVAAQGITPTGAWFTHHLKMDPNTFDFEIGLPVAVPVAATGRVKAGQRPEMKVARTVYQGPYEGLHTAWGEFNAWIAASGHTPGPDLWECYLAGPESSPDPASFRTEFTRQLIG